MPPPPPRRSSNAPLLIGLLGGGFVILVVIVLVVVFAFATPEKSDTEKLAAAATSLSSAKAVTMNGTFGSSSNQFTGELKATSGGRQTGEVTWGSHRVTILQADGNFFAKGNKAFWTDKGRYSGDAEFLNTGEHWGRLESYSMPLGFKDNMTPAKLVELLRRYSTSKFSIRSSEKTTLKGQEVDKITTTSATFYLSKDDDPQLVRVESTLIPTISADIKVHSTSSDIVGEIRNRIGELKNSFDPTKNPRVQEWAKTSSSCNASSCLVRAKVWSTRGTSSSVVVNAHFKITGDSQSGRYLGDCTTTVTVTGFEGAWAECRVASSAWTSWWNSKSGDKSWWKHADLTAAGASDADITAMQNALTNE